ncbi:ABC transporter ATP-binding protein [Microbacterium sp. zg.Y1090]|uniref:ABC transporter ATP-binding protein n=1 Tax=Microbacterium TaxID=33882 RepID=UPI00214CF76E|nr:MULTISPECIES: ABC transporter ATP-binding protein [unclassified Microbacterium]MCR2812674.1 ABC transporter ATP-binding protein [Microbacterium sp. zg.Y1084]MCR2817530.1 ABC transporter ATP-binding protein [Microbacterium sp. zg.Y1090]MDL5485828.1 ABC transporter ATP-binding protein [Microbacterium sp. zg-Y1211]WIM28987.1 ABC transporter ATP-binding protein [Microbacterium sp. zg-Y1090]
MIRFDDVDVTFGDHRAVRGLNLEIQEGEFFTLLGPSGCGKTTALRSLAGFIQPSSGRILIGDRDVTNVASEKRGVGMVFQNYALFPSMNVRENIAFGLAVRKTSKAEQRRLVDEIAERTGLAAAQLDKNVAELSGGQQQRVAIARALVLAPKILLLDEPLSNLDAKLRVQLREQLKQLQHEVGVTTVYVTHDQEEALTLSDRIAVLDAGALQQVGTPEEIYDRSATSFVCRFIGESNRLTPAVLARLRESAAASGAASDLPVLDENAESYVRPEKVAVTVGPPVWGATDGVLTVDGIVGGRTYHGSHSVYTIAVDDATLRVSVAGSAAAKRWEPGTPVTLGIDPRWVLQYPEG